MSSSDPRLPAAARPYVHPVTAPQDLPPDYSSLLAIVFGVAGVMLRYKAGSWLALIFCVQSLANMRSAENDLKQIIMAATWRRDPPRFFFAQAAPIRPWFAVMGMVTQYVGPNLGKASSAGGG